MTQKKFIQIASITVASVWVFCITFAIAYTLRSRSVNKAQTDPGMIVTNVPITSPLTTATPATQANPGANAVTNTQSALSYDASITTQPAAVVPSA